MRIESAWFLLAALIGACAIPNVEIVDSLDGASGGSTNSDAGGTSNHAGTKGSAGKAGSSNPTTGAGTDSGGGAPDIGQGGEPSVGGAPTTGGTETGGSGGSRPTGGTGGSVSPPSGAVAKFCNEVTYNGQAVDMQLRIGTGASMVKIVAASGTCQPVVSHDCAPVPAGNKTVEVYFTDGTAFWTGSTANMKAGQAWVFAVYYDQAAQMPMFNGTPGSPALTADECASLDFSDVFPAAPPLPGGS